MWRLQGESIRDGVGFGQSARLCQGRIGGFTVTKDGQGGGSGGVVEEAGVEGASRVFW